MKKSEFLKELYDSVDRFLDNPTNENMVDFIVNECERLGMLPPDNKTGYYVGVNYGTKYANYEEQVPVHKWEEE